MSNTEALQDKYISRTSIAHRRAQGQFFTPRWVAQGMAQWVIKAQPTEIIDPAFGMGILLDECVRQGYKGRLIGTEIDAELVESWRRENRDSVFIELVSGNFLLQDSCPLQGVVANPPYNRFQNHEMPPYFLRKMHDILGESPSGYTNQYALFLYAVVSRLQEGGRAAFIVPSEFLGTGYGIQVKKFLMNSRRLRHLVIFDTAERIFPEAATTACVLLFGEFQEDTLSVWHLPGQADQSAFHTVCDGDIPTHLRPLIIPYAELDAEANWQGLGLEEQDWRGFVELRSFGRVKRGIATGANEFFVLSNTSALENGLLLENLLPCIASADSIKGVLFTDSDWNTLRADGKDAYLFDGMRTPNEAAEYYIVKGESAEYHSRYLTKMRSPWYRLEARNVAPLLLAVFGRLGFRAVLNHSNAVNLTAFHGFMPDNSYHDITALLWMYLQTPLARLAFLRQQRAYGDGLKKLEPGDWSKLLVPNWNLWSTATMEQARRIAMDGISALKRQDETVWQALIIKFQNLTDEECHAARASIEKTVPGDQLTLL